MNDINDTVGVCCEQRHACRRDTLGVAEAIPECLLVVGGPDGWKTLLYRGAVKFRSGSADDGTLVGESQAELMYATMLSDTSARKGFLS